jgi:transcriptional regulator with XRE-family HTH domain
MIRFSQRLQDVLASSGWTQKEFAARIGVSATNVSRWLGCKALPDQMALQKLVEVLPDEQAPGLIAAWVYDALPPNAGRLVKVEPKNPSSKVQESTKDDWPPGLDDGSRKKFVDFSRLATSHPDVMKIVDVLHAAAMRAASSEGGFEYRKGRKKP